LRIEFEGALYHVTARGNERRAIFRDAPDYRRFLDILGMLPERFGVLLHGYALMGNHYHLLIETLRPNLAKAMHYLNAGYTGYFNRGHKRAGHLLQGRYKALLIEKEGYLLAVSRYIHLNPVRAGIVEKPEKYRWSSYPEYVRKRTKKGWLEDRWILRQYSEDLAQARKLYKRFVEEGIQTPQSPFEELKDGLILGTESFLNEIKRKISVKRHKDIPQSRGMAQQLALGDVVDAVAERVGIEPVELSTGRRRNKRERRICLYLLRTLTDMGNEEIGKHFEISYSAVSKAVTFLREEIERDRATRALINEIEWSLPNSNFKT